MRNFAKPRKITALPLEARVVYTCFCLFLLTGYGTGIWLYVDNELGVSADAAEAYYLGSTASDQGLEQASTDAPDAAGPSLVMPAEIVDEPMPGMARFQKSPRQVMEGTHFHIFVVPILFLIIAHLYIMSSHKRSFKVGVVIFAFGSTLIHLLAPILIRFASPVFAHLVFPSALMMSVTWIYLTAWPVYEMWRPVPSEKSIRSSTQLRTVYSQGEVS